jgi:hypothetical protein
MKNASSGMWRRVFLVQTDVSEEPIASISRVQKSYSRWFLTQKTAFFTVTNVKTSNLLEVLREIIIVLPSLQALKFRHFTRGGSEVMFYCRILSLEFFLKIQGRR